MNYIQVDFMDLSEVQKEFLLAELSILDLNGLEEEDTQLSAFFEEKRFDDQTVKAIAISLKLEYHIKTIPPKDWNEEWERNFQPVLIDDFCSIRAKFHPKPKGILFDIIITPKMSFGTGHHATTALMVTLMKTIDLKDKKVFDFGTGTGILAILAEKLGAKSVLAGDVDDWAVENAKENFECNDTLNITLKKGSIQVAEGQHFDVLLANINRNVLLEQMENFSVLLNPNGKLLLSGILPEDVEIIRLAATRLGFFMEQQMLLRGWCAILFLKA